MRGTGVWAVIRFSSRRRLCVQEVHRFFTVIEPFAFQVSSVYDFKKFYVSVVLTALCSKCLRDTC